VTEPGKFQLECPDFAAHEDMEAEDQETLAAIDEGLKDSNARRTVPAREARKRLPKWITTSSTRKRR
jgi:predicted transcriptional regulator